MKCLSMACHRLTVPHASACLAASAVQGNHLQLLYALSPLTSSIFELLWGLILQVQRDYEELPADAVPQLRDSILQLLLRFGRDAPAVRTQLCLAMAALASHLPAAQWSEGGVLRWLMERFNGQDPAMAMSCMLELLTVLPQVCCARLLLSQLCLSPTL
jgi:hypothetical protein